MLIRSQNKTTLVNFEQATKINMCHGKNGMCGILVKFPFTDNKYKSHIDILGEYSTEEKAIKVLDMIQDAYARCESVKALSSGIMFEVTERIRNQEKAEDFKNEHRSTFVFQMPQDSEV